MSAGPGLAHPPGAADAARARLLARLIAQGAARPERVLLESEGLDLLGALGFAVPVRVVASGSAEIARWSESPVPGERAVLKAVSPRILHKSDVGAVAITANRPAALAEAARAMEGRLGAGALEGFLVCAYVAHEGGPGGEFLLGLRVTRDFGPVITLAPGGVHAEFLARSAREGEAALVLAPAQALESDVDAALERLPFVRLATRSQRGAAPRLAVRELAAAVRRFASLASDPIASALAEFEVNPLVVADGLLVALDALGRVADPVRAAALPRPIARIRRLLEPRTIAIMGVSERMNPGRIILRNVLREGFDPANVTVVKPGAEPGQAIEGCRCVPDLGALAGGVDLLVASVPAPMAAAAVARAADEHLAESVVLIPGGLEEREDAAPLVARMHESLERSRVTAWGGPVVNGGNCLGVRSRPGRCDTLFIPEYKLPRPPGEPDPVALVTGSGAFAVARTSQLADVQPLYTITIGNQTDLTASDYLEYLRDDPRVEIVALYLEGFRPGDGERFVRLARAFTGRGRPVILYLAGRTAAGAAAAASHTASVAGDFEVARQLARAAGVTVASTLADFDDLVRLHVRLRGRRAAGPALGALTNAGFEAVAIADNLGELRLADLAGPTRDAITAALERARLDGIVSVRNPIDVTPILTDEGYEAILRALLADPGVDVAVLGCVPLTQSLVTLPAGSGHTDDLGREDGLVRRMARLWRESTKPWVTVVDAGPMYDPLVRAMESNGLPVFRTADRALRLFGQWCAASGPPRRE